MPRLGFKMKLHAGAEAEYQRRHNEIWPELSVLLRDAGITHYSIFLEVETHTLFGVYDADDLDTLAQLPKQAVMQRWWLYMSDIMQTNADHSPVSIPLKEVFYLP